MKIEKFACALACATAVCATSLFGCEANRTQTTTDEAPEERCLRFASQMSPASDWIAYCHRDTMAALEAMNKTHEVQTHSIVHINIGPSGTSVTTSSGPFDGNWEGVLTISEVPIRSGQEWNWNSKIKFRLELVGDNVRVSTFENGAWRNWGRSFSVLKIDTNAVLTSITSGGDNGKEWIETWVFCVTKLDATHLETSWHRQVNNQLLPRSDPDAVFGRFGYGELTLVSAISEFR